MEIQNLNIKTDDRQIVFDANLLLREGKVHVLMEPNGSGKSTLLNVMMGHSKYTITNGNIFLDGKDITSLETEKKARLGLFLSMQYLPGIEGVTVANFLYQVHKAIGDNDLSMETFYDLLKNKAKKFDVNSDFLKKHVNVGLSGRGKSYPKYCNLPYLNRSSLFLTR